MRFILSLALLAASLFPTLGMAADTLTRGPYLQKTSTSSTILRWRTTAATDSIVRYGTTPGELSLSVINPEISTEHRIPITGLSPGTTYYYTLESQNGTILPPSPETYFKTNPLPSNTQRVRVWVLGDAGKGNENQLAVLRGYLGFAAQSGPADLMLMLGDNAYSRGEDVEYQTRLFDVYAAVLKNTTLWPTFGNHDGLSASSATLTGPYYDSFSLPRNAEAGGVASGTEAYYSFDYGSIHFICLNSYDVDRSMGAAMASWLKADLAASNLPWKIAYWHHPPYSKGSHDSDTEQELIEMRENIVPLLEDGGVDLVLAGHSHSYERSVLLDGHYGPSTSLTDAMILDAGSGNPIHNESYHKPLQTAAHRGTVYVVAGNAAVVGGGNLNHPIMHYSAFQLGSLIIDALGDELNVKLVSPDSSVPDQFTLKKNCSTLGPCPTLPNVVTFPRSERGEWGSRRGSFVALRAIDRRYETLRASRARGRNSRYSFSHRWGFRIPNGAGAQTLSIEMSSRRNIPLRLQISFSEDGVHFQSLAILETTRGFKGTSSLVLPHQLVGSPTFRIRSIPISRTFDRYAELKLNSMSIH